MFESCFVIRCEEFFIMFVIISNGFKEELLVFLLLDKKVLFLLLDMLVFQLDFIQYYYFGFVISVGNLLVKYFILVKFKVCIVSY